MMGSDSITWWSVSAYRLILRVYPRSFRNEFGDSMAHIFAEAVRDTLGRAGVAGLATLWMRTVTDVVRSVCAAYLSDTRDPMSRRFVAAGVVYACALVGVVAYGAIAFREFYAAPAFSRFGATGAPEATLIAGYEAAMRGDFGAYRLFTLVASFALAVLLGLTSGLFGIWQKSLVHGGAALAAGTFVTILAFEILPTVWFPFDRYAVGALWVMGGGVPLAAALCLVVMVLGGVRPRVLRRARS